MRKNIAIRISVTLLAWLLQGALLFITAQTFRWMWAWAYIATGLLILIMNAVYLPKEIIAERGSRKKEVKRWDKIIVFSGLIPFAGLFILSGLDFRFQWTGSVPSTVNIAGLILVFTGAVIFTRAMVENPFFSTMAGIQNERGHTIVISGPYSIIRHPGYASLILMNLATPPALGSAWALTMAALATLLLIIRTALEDRMLSKALEGYQEYKQQVRYRLIPFIW